jgi:hypothetical protein
MFNNTLQAVLCINNLSVGLVHLYVTVLAGSSVNEASRSRLVDSYGTSL